MPAHWLKIDPIKLGDKNVYLYLMVLTKLHPDNYFIGLSSSYQSYINDKPKFNLPGFNPSKDLINTNLSIQLYNKPMTLTNFTKKLDEFITKHALKVSKHREFVKIE